MSRTLRLFLAMRLLAWGLFLALGCWSARADGGHIALHATVGSYTITLFTAPAPLVAGPCDLSLLVQSAGPPKQHDGQADGPGGAPSDSGPVVEDASATITLTRAPAGGDAPALTFALTRQGSSATPLLSAHVTLPPGTYELAVTVRGASALEASALGPSPLEARFDGQLIVEENHQRRTTLLFAVLLPLAAVVLFLINQQAKRQAGVRRQAPTPPVS